MGLQVWLPLNGRLNNQGVSDGNIVGTSITYSSSGKLGTCAKLTNSSSINTNWNINHANTSSVYMGGWFKFNQAEINPITTGRDYTSTYATTQGNLLGFNSYGGFSIQWYTNNIYTGGSFQSISVQGYLRTSTASARSTSQKLIPFDTWTHIMVGFNRDEGKLYLYVDGEVVGSPATIPSFTDMTSQMARVNNAAIGGGNGFASLLPCYVNDVRFYDHALTSEEIKELSKGLVLRYAMGYPYVEGTTNLVTTDDGLSNTCYNGATGKYSYGTNTDMYKTVGTFNNRKSAKVYMGTNGLAAYPYIYFDAFDPAGTVTKTLSFYYYPTIGDVVIPYSYNGAYNWKWTSGEQSGVGNNTSQVIIPVKVNEWNYITVTAWREDTSLTSRGVGYIRLGSTSHTSNTSNYWLFSNVQVEAKDHATGYAGKNGTRTGNIVYDISGNRYNGTCSQSIPLEDGGPLFNRCMKFTTGHVERSTLGSEIKTLSCWAKTTANKSTSQHMVADSASEMCISFYQGTIIGVFGTTRSTGSKCTLGSEYKENDWNHFVVVKTSTDGQRDIYCNGVKLTPTSNDYWSASTGFFVGARNSSDGNQFKGYISDVRAYATTLTQEDVINLYKYNRL